MPQDTTQLERSLEPLTLQAFSAFCEDITSMFGNTADCSADDSGQGPLAAELKGQFKKLAAVNQVQALGTIDGTFQLLLDQAGLFVLAGVFVMLPEKRIIETIRGGTLKDADYINDAIKEVGNLLVGSWDRIFREESKGHKHFKQTGTFVGSIWDNAEENIGLGTDENCRYVICRMKVDDFPEFKCAAVFSDRLFEAKAQNDSPEQSEPKVDASANDAAEPETTEDSTEQGDTPTEPEHDQPEPAEPDPTEPTLEASPPSDPETTSTENDDTPDSEPVVPQSPAVSSEPESPNAKPGPVAQAIRQLTQDSANALPNAAARPGCGPLPALTASQIMNPTVLWVSPEDTVEEVLRQMQQHNVGYVPAGQDGRIEGLVSRSDIIAAISPYLRPIFANWRRPVDDATLKIRIKWFMSRPVHTIGPDASLNAIMETMTHHSVRGLPVMDGNGQLLGMISVYDVFAALLSSTGADLTGRPQQAPPGVM